jgi:hypothetical protein
VEGGKANGDRGASFVTTERTDTDGKKSTGVKKNSKIMDKEKKNLSSDERIEHDI